MESPNGAAFPYHPYKWDSESLDRQLFYHCVVTMFDNDLMPRHTFSQPDAYMQALAQAPVPHNLALSSLKYTFLGEV